MLALLAVLAVAAQVAGLSTDGREIRATREGEADAPVSVLVVGSIHGNETAGHAVVRALRRVTPPAGVQLHLVTSVNPDGVARDTRQNARGVDLNRNFPRRWRGGGRAGETFFPGRAAGSEAETRIVRRLVERVRPDVAVWFHQQLRLVNLSPGADPAVVRAYARRAGLPVRTLPRYRGTATSWQNHAFPGSSAFVVELAAGRLDPAGVRRHVRAVIAAGADRAKAGRTAAATQEAGRPAIRWNPIPFGPRRVRETRAYSRRHYGNDRARLLDPKVIVEHVTATADLGSAFNTFAANARDPEFGERPGVCTHFIVDRDGTIHQLVRLKWMCRHTVGLNWTAIGIEHVGRSDAEVLSNRRQLDASRRLTRWLQAHHGIAQADVIGHAESVSSPYHRERVARMRTRTHSDFSPASMRRYLRGL